MRSTIRIVSAMLVTTLASAAWGEITVVDGVCTIPAGESTTYGVDSATTYEVYGTISNPEADIVMQGATINVHAGGKVISGTRSTSKWLKMESGANTINVYAGGEVQMWHLQCDSSTACAFNLKGGKVTALNMDTGYCKYLFGNGKDGTVVNNLSLAVGEEGGAIEVSNRYIRVAQPISVNGTLAKTGWGILELTSTATTTGSGTIKAAEGVLAVNTGYAFSGPLEIGRAGAVTVVVSDSTLEVDQQASLFTASSVDFEDENDSLAESLFLTGNVIGYTLSSEAGDNVTTVKATVTDVTNIDSTRKVTTFVAGDADDACTGNTYNGVTIYRHVDSGEAFSNGPPANDSYDVAVYCGTQFLMIWGANTRTYGDLVIRGGTLKVKPSSASPTLAVKHIAGNGTLSLRHVGLENKDGIAMTVDSTVTVEFSCAGISDTSVTWAKGNNATTTVNGPVVVTNGFLKVCTGVVFNGPVTIGAWSTGSHLSYLDADTTINGTWTIQDGGDFNFASKTVTMGEDAKLVLEGTGKITGDSGTVFPSIELGEDYNGIYGSLNAVSNSYILAGGTLHLTKDAAANATNVVLKSGTLVVDISSELAASVGTSYTLSNVALADGAKLSDLTFKFSGQNFKCTAAVDATGTITVTTAEPDDGDNHWVGGAYGTFETAANWTLGKPITDQRIVFDNAATVSFDMNKPEIGTLVFNADVTFNRGSGGEKFYIQGAEGTGTLTLDNMGIANITGQSASISNNLNMINGAWFGDYQYTGNLSIYGNISGSGDVKIWGKSGNLNLYGDNSGFTGYVHTLDGHRPVYFRAPKAGFSNATSFELTGSLYLWFNEGTITFGGLKLHATVNHGINMPAEAATSTEGVTLVVGNNDGAVAMSGDNTYRAYTANGNSWTDGCANFTLRKVGSGSFTDHMDHTHKLELEGGTTTFNCDQKDGTTTITVTNATIKAAADRTLGTVTFGSGSCLAADLAWSTNTVDEVVTTNGLTTATLTVTGSADLSNTIVLLGNTDLTNQVDKAWTNMPTLLSVTGTGNTLSGTPTLGCTAISNLVVKVANNKLKLAYGTPVTPGETITVETETEAKEAAAKPINLPVERATLGQQASYFTNVVTKVESVYTVVTKLNEEKVTPDSSASAMAMTSEDKVALTPGNVKKGLYYGLAELTDPTDKSTKPSGYTLATGDNLTLTTEVDSNTNVKYYRVWVSDTKQ